MQLKKALEGYWLENESRLAKTTQVGYQWAFTHFVAFIGAATPIEKITTDDIRRFMTHCAKTLELCDKSRSNIWVVLSSFWSWAEKEPALRIPHVIRGVVQQPLYGKKKIVPYTQTEVTAMVAACDHGNGWKTRRGKLVHSQRDTALRDRAIIILFIDTGLRASELCGLKIKDYNSTTGAIDVFGKGSKERTVIAETFARKALWRYLSGRPDAGDEDPLFASRSNLHLDNDSLRHLVQRIAVKVGIKDATLHRFRHTFAYNFLRNGGNPIELQRLLGHEEMDTVNIYVNLAESDLQAAQQRASPANNWRLK